MTSRASLEGLDQTIGETRESRLRTRPKGAVMADPAPVGSDVSAGTYQCTNCGYKLSVHGVQSLPPCPKCEGPYSWKALTGGDAKDDPYPDE
jgi:hypothetical protein